MKKLKLLVCLTLIGNFAIAQHQEISDKPETYKDKQAQIGDSTSLLSAFKSGKVNGHFRYFFMSTQNQGGLTDYYANAAGGGLRFETGKFHGFKFSVSGFYTFNIGSSDLGKKDSITGQPNRYEIGLFDVTDPYNKKNIARLEEFNLKYIYKKSNIVFGKQLINTPFINLQDGRMAPTSVEGIWLDFNEIKKIRIEGGWLYAISPRGTEKWFRADKSIGIYPVGLNIDGSKSQYFNNLTSKGIFLLGATYTLNKNIKLQGWDMFTENIFNTAMLQADFVGSINNKHKIFAALQFIRQDAVKDGGNADAHKTYFEKRGAAMSYGAKLGWKSKRMEASLNYNRITADGRYLMPREWGRDPMFTFLPRERNEGLGDVHAVMGRINYDLSEIRLKTSFTAGYYQLPDVKNYRLNKYGLPSYIHLNADVRYSFIGFWQGLDTQLLVTAKLNAGETYKDKKFEFNKVNMVLFNFVLNYHF